MRQDKLSKQNVILYLCGIIPVVWLGLLIAPCLKDGLPGLVQQFGSVMQNPFQMRPNYLTEYFPKYIAKHGMPKMRFHDLRHSCASLLLANGVPLKQIQEWLGHSDFSTTANIYAHLDYRSKISSAQAMEQGMLLPRSDDFGSRWENVTEQGKITEPDLNPGF